MRLSTTSLAIFPNKVINSNLANLEATIEVGSILEFLSLSLTTQW